MQPAQIIALSMKHRATAREIVKLIQSDELGYLTLDPENDGEGVLPRIWSHLAQAEHAMPCDYKAWRDALYQATHPCDILNQIDSGLQMSMAVGTGIGPLLGYEMSVRDTAQRIKSSDSYDPKAVAALDAAIRDLFAKLPEDAQKHVTTVMPLDAWLKDMQNALAARVELNKGVAAAALEI